MDTILVCGGAGFIGSNFVLHALEQTDARVIALDKLTYAGSRRNLSGAGSNRRFTFVRGDIGNRRVIDEILRAHRPRLIVNFAAETHVDRSIAGPGGFVETNVLATLGLLEGVRDHLRKTPTPGFRMLQVSTDEVYGSLGESGKFNESAPYAPSSPYAASKAAADHLVRAFHRTFGLPALIANCSNNYGFRQHPEKLIPRMASNAVLGRKLPVYGDGRNIRDWLYVEDNCGALHALLTSGKVGENYNVGGENERTNLEVVEMVCRLLQEEFPPITNPALRRKRITHYLDLQSFVPDRPGHDYRYAVDNRKIRRELGWRPTTDFGDGLRRTIRWYLANREWCVGWRDADRTTPSASRQYPEQLLQEKS